MTATLAERQGRAPGLYDERLQREQQEKLFRRQFRGGKDAAPAKGRSDA